MIYNAHGYILYLQSSNLCRYGEVLILKPPKIWKQFDRKTYSTEKHKTEREIFSLYIGLMLSENITWYPFLMRSTVEQRWQYLFSSNPNVITVWRRSPLKENLPQSHPFTTASIPTRETIPTLPPKMQMHAHTVHTLMHYPPPFFFLLKTVFSFHFKSRLFGCRSSFS